MSEETQDRPIEDLIKEKTYQSMSDSEINKIIAYTIDKAQQNSITKELCNQTHTMSEIMHEHYKNLEAQADAFLERLINTGTSYLQTVDVSENE